MKKLRWCLCFLLTILICCGAAAAVENGEIYMESAACPDQICVEHGPLRPGGTPIVCLPNRLSIQWIERDAAVDAVSGGR